MPNTSPLLDPQRLNEAGALQNAPQKHTPDNAMENVFYRLGGIDERLSGQHAEILRLGVEQKVIKDEVKVSLDDVKHGIARLEKSLVKNQAVDEYKEKAKQDNQKTISLSIGMVTLFLTVMGAFATAILWMANGRH